MSNFKCNECGFINIDCGKDGYKTPKEIELEFKVKDLEEALEHIISDLKSENLTYAVYGYRPPLTLETNSDTILASSLFQDPKILCYKDIPLTKWEDLKKECKKYKQALRDIQRYCSMQNLKYDETACEILNIVINNLKENE